MATCKACGAVIEWAETQSGKSMPLDSEPSAFGQWCFVNGKTWQVRPRDRELHRPTYTPHWATCPEADSFRRR